MAHTLWWIRNEPPTTTLTPKTPSVGTRTKKYAHLKVAREVVKVWTGLIDAIAWTRPVCFVPAICVEC